MIRSVLEAYPLIQGAKLFLKKEKERQAAAARKLLGAKAGAGGAKGVGCDGLPPVLKRMCSATRGLTEGFATDLQVGAPCAVVHAAAAAVKRVVEGSSR